ncbi:MAG: hypothetical protein U0V49_09450 [Saprospiraceae bacterium]
MSIEQEFPESILAGLQRRNSFLVPKGYFTSLPDEVSCKLSELSLQDRGLNRKDNLHIPEGYFQRMQTQVMQQVRLGEEDKQNFKIPDNYFSELQDKVMTKVSPSKEKGRIVQWSFGLRAVWRVAAMIAVVAGLFWLQQSRMTRATATFNLAQIDDETLISFLAENEADLSLLSEGMDENQISGMNVMPQDDLDEESINELINQYQ